MHGYGCSESRLRSLPWEPQNENLLCGIALKIIENVRNSVVHKFISGYIPV